MCRGAGRGAGGRSLSMDVTVSELMELFLQSPLVTWVSAPGSCPIVGAPAPLPAAGGRRTPDPPGAPGSQPRGAGASARAPSRGRGPRSGVRRCFQLWSWRSRPGQGLSGYTCSRRGSGLAALERQGHSDHPDPQDLITSEKDPLPQSTLV